MNYWSVAALLMAGISLYMGIYYFWFHAKTREHKEYLSFSMLCISISVYDIFCSHLYSAETCLAGAVWQHRQLIALGLICIFSVKFVSDFIDRKNKIIDYFVYIFFGIFSVASIANPQFLTTDIPSPKNINILGNLVATYNEVEVTFPVLLAYSASLLVSYYLINSLFTFYASNRKKGTYSVLIGMLIFSLGTINDVAVGAGVYEFVYVVEFAFMVIVIVMSYSLTNTFIISQKTLKKNIENIKELAAAVDQAAESIVITNSKGIITYVNPHCERMTGYTKSELIGHSPKIFQSGKHSDEFYAKAWETLKQGETWRGQFTNKKKDGTLFEEKAVISPVYNENKELIAYVNVKRDVTNEILLESQARQSQKMAAIGQFAHKVAHDVTNKLVVILGSIQYIKDNTKDKPIVNSMVDNIIEASNRISSLTADLMAFAHPAKLTLKTLPFDKIISSLEDILQRTLGKDVTLEFKLNAPGIKAKVDPVQIEQALVHIAINAVEAMPNGGRLTVETNQTHFTFAESMELQAATHERDRHFGNFVTLRVSDSGEGMTKDQLTHIFEPFFTTKKDQQNIGLGLPTVYRIVQMHNGHIHVDSEPNKGTQFNIHIPIATQTT